MAVRGKIVPSEHRIAHIIPRFPGIVREGRKHIGDKVEKGEVLAIVESNQSLQPFEVRSQIAGTVINGHLIVGEYVSENQWVYIVADLSEVWADFYVPLGERNAVRVGQLVEVRTGLDSEFVTGTVSYVAPYADERSQSQLVRVVLPNNDARFVPGMFVTGDLIVSDDVAKVAVKMSASQTFRDWKVVFANVDDTYEIRPVTLGRSDEEWVEVLQGLAAGERYVSTNSYILKADILKAGAEHDH
jgi:cobalt-zinc-cadmium efflux system membrane fusion protein